MSLWSTCMIYPSIAIFRRYAAMFRVGMSFIFSRIKSRSASVTRNLICTVLFRPSMLCRSFPFLEGLGNFPTSHFQPTRRSAGGRKYGSGYPLPMLATKLFPYFLLRRKASFCQSRTKEKRCNPHSRLQRSFLPIQFSCSTSAISFAVAVTIRIPLSLIPSSSVSSCRRPVLFPAVLSGKKNWSTDMS